MTNDAKKYCTETSPEELLLLAYGEAARPGLAEHAARCPECQAYLAEVRAARAKIQLPLVSPAESSVHAVLRQARAGARPEGRRFWSAWSGRSAWTALAAAAAVVIMVTTLTYFQPPAGPHTGNGSPIDYLTGVSSQLIGWDLALDSESACGTAEASPAPDKIHDLENSTADLERDLNLLNYSNLSALGDDDAPGSGKE